MSDQFLAEIRIFPFNFAPIGWAQCNGQIMSISQNTALFSLLGTNYGGNGQSTFGLPNFQGAVPINQGQGPGLSLYDVGQTGGSTNVTLLQNQIATHTHLVNADQDPATSNSPAGQIFMRGIWGTPPADGGVALYSTLATGDTLSSFNLLAIGPAGGTQPHNNLMPYLALNFCIALSGIFPPRS
jgi:microcystin-dependent protein